MAKIDVKFMKRDAKSTPLGTKYKTPKKPKKKSTKK